MRIWPAIDIKNGKCVRLSQGDYDGETVYGLDPADMASRWVSEGATGLHIIDLDGAMGRTSNTTAIAEIAESIDVEIQVGGGIHSEQVIEDYLSIGIKRLIVATKSVTDPKWLESMAQRYVGHLVVSIDTKNGKVAYDGWQQVTDLNATEHANSISHLPIAGIIYTDIDRAGVMTGPNFDLISNMKTSLNVPLVSSGGIRNLEDVRKLVDTGVQGCVIGRALYDGKVTLPEAISVATAVV